MTREPVPPPLRDGALRFARYALPPNRLGYCGPGDDVALFEQAVALAAAGPGPAGAPGRLAPDAPADGRGDPAVNRGTDAAPTSALVPDLVSGLRALAEGFEGAWPYLELIAGANRLPDPLDDRVVAAYWLGGPRAGRVGAFAAGNHVEERFRRRAGRWWAQVASALEPGVAPTHAFHVMVVGPWVGMLRGRPDGGDGVDAPLRVMDRCRIRRGRVLAVEGDEAVVSTDRLALTRGRVVRDAPAGGVTERVRLGEGGDHPCGPVAVGDTVALHWDWVCEVLDPASAAAVDRAEAEAMDRANRALASPGADAPG